MEQRIREICRVMMDAEREAAKLMLQAHEVPAETKTDRRNVVTEFDRRVQALLVQRLREAAPEARFYCEEQEEHDDLYAEELFVIDPIDGTMNFVHGFHHSCLSVAYARRGELCAGAIYNPYVDEMFHAVRGEGAFLNSRAIRVSREALRDSIVCYGTAPYDMRLADESFSLARIAFEASLDLRREGAAALDLCSVAAGRAGLYFEMRVSPWDYAAGLLIVQEAGGDCRRLDGRPLVLEPERDSIAVGAPGALAEFLSLVKSRRAST